MTYTNKENYEIILQKYKLDNSNKDENNYNKECLICLEPIIIEEGNLISLPCKCANSIYHKNCITQMLLSGVNKNFCPHCKQKYKISKKYTNNTNNTIINEQHYNQEIVNELGRRFEIDRQNDRIKKSSMCKIFFHFLFNSIINVFSGNFIFNEGIKNILFRILVFTNIFKIFFNAFIVYVIKKEPEKINKIIICSYILQFLIFGYTIELLIIYFHKPYKYTFIAIIVINVAFSLMDIAFGRLFREESEQNNRINFL